MKVSAKGASRRNWEARRLYEKLWREAHKKEQKAFKKDWYEENRPEILTKTKRGTDRRWAEDPDKERARQRACHLKHAYGLTSEDWEQMFIDQNGECAICKNWLAISGRKTHTDHDPDTGVVRGLLCGPHNSGLGLFRHSPEVLRWAADYLEKFRK